MKAKTIGNKGENTAAKYLRRKGYKIVKKNYSCRFGEIDIIAENDDYLVFVEVKARNRNSIAAAREFVDKKKQNRIIMTAKMYLSAFGTDKQPRFDVIEINTDKLIGKIDHVENAFGE